MIEIIISQGNEYHRQCWLAATLFADFEVNLLSLRRRLLCRRLEPKVGSPKAEFSLHLKSFNISLIK